MKNYDKCIAAAGIIMLISIVALPKELYRSEESQKGVETAGVKLLKSMEEKDLYAIEEEIESVQEQMRKNDDVHENTETVVSDEMSDTQTEPAKEPAQANTEGSSESAVDYCAGVDVNAYHYRELYADSLIMGDSIAESLLYYNILEASNVVAKIGASMRAVDEQLDVAVRLEPQNVFLYFGLNDVAEVKSDYERFRVQYENMIMKVKQRLPNAHIYANLLLPVMNPEIAGGPEYEDLTPYNEMIKEVCEKYQVPCLDSTGIVKEEYYEPDGCHFKYQFYDYWLYSMALQAGLLS